MLPPPDPRDPNTLDVKIYFFNSPANLSIQASRKNPVSDVVKHIMTMYKRTTELSSKKPLKFPDDPTAYELRLIDDDESPYTPFYEIAPLEPHAKLGDFDSLAFVETRKKRKQTDGDSPTKKKEFPKGMKGINVFFHDFASPLDGHEFVLSEDEDLRDLLHHVEDLIERRLKTDKYYWVINEPDKTEEDLREELLLQYDTKELDMATKIKNAP